MRGYYDEIAALRDMSDPNLSASGQADRQRAARVAASERLLAARPVLPKGARSRDDVLAGLSASSADEIARMQHEQAKVRTLLDNGRPLGEIIAAADSTRALAIADLVETLPQVLESNSGAEIVAEVRGLVFDRLADLGVEAAESVRDVEQRNAPDIAWHRAMSEAAAGSDASIAAWQDVYRADPDGYGVAHDGRDGQVDEWLRRFDAAVDA
ncbi:hypothetical protein [Microbacterium luticocti]|uniref:hypothetical protein n=1 Tax=Microbacterium luticocti TaxID=451764 RepID=UPI0003F90C5B|nr:hypothetical protein [Microbacterium luticocti]